MYYFEEEIAKETRAAGLRGVLGQTVIQFPVADAKTKPNQERFVASTVDGDDQPQPARSTKTAEAVLPTGGTTAPVPVQPAK